jgi:hypothetical protein
MFKKSKKNFRTKKESESEEESREEEKPTFIEKSKPKSAAKNVPLSFHMEDEDGGELKSFLFEYNF